jgi:hypothetical protein
VTILGFARAAACNWRIAYGLWHGDAVELMAAVTDPQIDPPSEAIDCAQWFVLL